MSAAAHDFMALIQRRRDDEKGLQRHNHICSVAVCFGGGGGGTLRCWSPRDWW